MEPTPIRKCMIVTDKGDMINIDHISKIQYGTSFVVSDDLSYRISFAVAVGAGSSLKYTYADAATALASYNTLVSSIKDAGYLIADLTP